MRMSQLGDLPMIISCSSCSQQKRSGFDDFETEKTLSLSLGGGRCSLKDLEPPIWTSSSAWAWASRKCSYFSYSDISSICKLVTIYDSPMLTSILSLMTTGPIVSVKTP
jgi:hypothetical protein